MSDKRTDHTIRSPKESAVAQWRDACEMLDNQDSLTADEQFLLEADIHDSEDRREIIEIIAHGDFHREQVGLAFEDAFSDLRSEFEDLWG